jgi:hypothetical protein
MTRTVVFWNVTPYGAVNVTVLSEVRIVTYRPIARQRLGKHIPAATNM